MKKVLGCVRRADQDFNLIEPGDHIMVGVSGGKDSVLLVKALRLYQYFSKKDFRLTAATLTMGIGNADYEPVAAMCRELGVPYVVRETNIGRIVFEERKEKNPCALCANMRRGALNTLANELGANKVALGHHREDVLETFLLSLLYEGRIHTFSPRTELARSGITVIRPMVYLPENHIKHVVRVQSLPIVKSPCPAGGKTKREDMKALLTQLCKHSPDLKEKMLHALKNAQILK